MKLYCIALLAALTVCAGAADLTTKSGKVYAKYSVDGPSIKGLVIFHELGAATIPYADLPDDLRAKYKADEEKAAATLKAQEEQRKKLEEQRQAEAKRQAEMMEKEAAERIRLEKEEAARIEKRKLCHGMCGFYLGDKLDNSYVIEKNKDGSISVNPKEGDIPKSASILLHVDKDQRIYRMTFFLQLKKNVENTKTAFRLKQSFVERYPNASNNIEDQSRGDVFIQRGKVVYENAHAYADMNFMAYDKQGDATEGLVYMRFYDKDNTPKLEWLTKDVEKKYDDMQSVTWYSPKYDSKKMIEVDKRLFIVNPYVGVFDNGNKVLRLKATYAGNNWIFFEKIQFKADNGTNIFISVSQKDRLTEILSPGVTEWIDIVAPSDFTKLADANEIKVKFYGKYSPEFELPPHMLKEFVNILNLYKTITSQK